MLKARNLEVVYDDVVLALRGVSLEVPAGSIVRSRLISRMSTAGKRFSKFMLAT